MGSLIGRFVSLSALAILSVLAPAAAQAQTVELFAAPKPNELQSAAAARPRARGEQRERLATLSVEALSSARARPRDGEAKTLRIRLFPDADADFAQTDSEPAFSGGEIWNGETEDGSATLVFSDGGVTGRVQLKGRVFRIEPAGGPLHRIVEIDRSGLPPPGPERVPPQTNRDTQRQAPDAHTAVAQAEAGDTTITALFAYTKRARDYRPGASISAKIELAVALTNKAYEASGVRIRLKLVGTMLVRGYDESGRTYETILDHLTDQRGAGAPFQAVGAERNAAKADLVALVRDDTGFYCGLAWAPSNPTRATADLGYSEISVDCIESDTTAHELGHNMGLYHDRYAEKKYPPNDTYSSKLYNFGYTNTKKRVYDIMAYPDRCDDSGLNCTPISKFSSPDLTVQKQPFGIPKGTKGAADAVRRLNETRTGVAAYR